MTDSTEFCKELDAHTKIELYHAAKKLKVQGISRLTKATLVKRLLEREQNEVRGALKEVTWLDRNKKTEFSWIATVILLLGFTLECSSNRNQIKQYKEQQTPELTCNYSYSHGHDALGFVITNTGLVDASNVWAEESVFLIIGDQAYEGVDVPHFNWIVYNGSREKIWDIPKNSSDQEVELPRLQHKAFDQLMGRFQTSIISKWAISCTSPTSQKRCRYDVFFIHSLSDRLPKRLEETTGGTLKRDQIRTYLSAGPVHQIRIFALTDDFELDAPVDFRITKDGVIHPLHSWTKLSIEELNKTFYWHSEAPPQCSDDITGSLRYVWKHRKGGWAKLNQIKGKTQVMTQVMTTAVGYLNPEDRKRVEANPDLLRKGTGDKTKAIELLNNVKEKFIKNRYK